MNDSEYADSIFSNKEKVCIFKPLMKSGLESKEEVFKIEKKMQNDPLRLDDFVLYLF